MNDTVSSVDWGTYVTHVVAICLGSGGVRLVDFLAKVPTYSDVAAQRCRFRVMLHLRHGG